MGGLEERMTRLGPGGERHGERRLERHELGGELLVVPEAVEHDGEPRGVGGLDPFRGKRPHQQHLMGRSPGQTDHQLDHRLARGADALAPRQHPRAALLEVARHDEIRAQQGGFGPEPQPPHHEGGALPGHGCPQAVFGYPEGAHALAELLAHDLRHPVGVAEAGQARQGDLPRVGPDQQHRLADHEQSEGRERQEQGRASEMPGRSVRAPGHGCVGASARYEADTAESTIRLEGLRVSPHGLFLHFSDTLLATR